MEAAVGAETKAAKAARTALTAKIMQDVGVLTGDLETKVTAKVDVVGKRVDVVVASVGTLKKKVEDKLGAVVACLAGGKTVTKDYTCGKKLQEDGAITEATKTKCDATLLGTHRYNTKARLVEYCVLVGDKKYGFSGLKLSGLGWQKAPGDSAQNPAESCMQIKKRGIKRATTTSPSPPSTRPGATTTSTAAAGSASPAPRTPTTR